MNNNAGLLDKEFQEKLLIKELLTSKGWKLYQKEVLHLYNNTKDQINLLLNRDCALEPADLPNLNALINKVKVLRSVAMIELQFIEFLEPDEQHEEYKQ